VVVVVAVAGTLFDLPTCDHGHDHGHANTPGVSMEKIFAAREETRC